MSQTHRVLGTEPIPSLASHLQHGGGRGLAAALERTPDEIVAVVERSGLRGRGGAGFPTGRKWRTLASLRSVTDAALPVIVNAAEGEPGTFKDRALLRANPFLVLEGAAIAARAVGASDIVVATKASFREEQERLRSAVADIEASGWLDGISIRVVEGPGEYLFGEETALLEVIDGRPPFPRIVPPYRRGVHERAEAGWGGDGRRGDGPGALVDNVETLANVVGIFANGVDWYRSTGTTDSPGTVICTVTGDTLHHGVGEFTMGTPLREVIETLGGGITADRRIAVVLNGVSNPPLAADLLDTPLTYEDMAAAGSGLGSASFIVIDDSTSLPAVAAGAARFLAVESCGQCEPCKRDGLDVAAALESSLSKRPAAHGGALDVRRVNERLAGVARGARCALAGQTERIVGRLVELAETSSNHPSEIYPIVPLVEIVDGRAVLDLAHLEKRFDWTHPGEGDESGVWPVQRLADQPVEIDLVRTPESPGTGSGVPTAPEREVPVPSPDPFGSIRTLGDDLTEGLEALRRSEPTDRREALRSLRHHIERYQLATERIVFPMVERLDEEHGAEVAWYPEHHTQAAARLLRDLDLGSIPLSARLVDQLCIEIHTSILEVERRVLPLIERALADSRAEAALIAAGLDELIEPPAT